MKLINTISIFLITILFNPIYAQNDYCGTDDNPPQNTTNSNNSCNIYNPSNYSASVDENYLNSFGSITIDLKIWGLQNDNGNVSMTAHNAYNMESFINNVYNELDICFNLVSFEYIESDQQFDTDHQSFVNFINNSQYVNNDAMNIYVTNDLDVRGRSFDYNQNVIRADQMNKGILNHEIGHSFGLRHPFVCERVTRDPTDPNYNADIAGDYVVDTNAAPQFYSIMDDVSDDCMTFSGNQTNCYGEQYTNLTESDLKNIMTWTFCPRIIFTTGQKIRMRETIDNCPSDFNNIINTSGVNLASLNSDEDFGFEPDNQTDVIWESPDIWVRNQPDGFTNQQHEDLEYIDDNTPVYVYVKVRNIGCDTSTGSDDLKLYWAKGGIGQQTWPDVWTGMNNSSNSLDIGNQIGSQTIPAVDSGNEKILEFQWQPKNPDVYENAGFTSKPWMFCFLSRIESTDDPMTFTEVSNPATNTRNNNNIVYKNTTTINLSGSDLIGSISAGNFNLEQPVSSDINFFTNQGNLIWEEAEIRVRLDESLWEAWQNSGANSTDVRILNSSERIIYLNGNNSSLNDINFDPNEWGVLTPRINFLIREVTDETYTLNVSQTLSETDEVLGGFTYNINRNSSRQYFTADAIVEDDQNNTQLEAENINENATYNWYDEDGNFISSGQTLSVTNTNLKDYKLEVIADSDGHKDYKIFTVKEDRSITSISPNPTLNDFTINYKVGTANSAFVTITNVMTGVSNNYILDLSNNSKSINLSNNPSGQYIINLVTDNVIVDTKNLLKN